MKRLMLVLVMVVLLMVGCTTTPTKSVVKRSQEIHYDQSGQFIGRTIVRTYEDGSVQKEHFDASGNYIGRSRSK